MPRGLSRSGGVHLSRYCHFPNYNDARGWLTPNVHPRLTRGERHDAIQRARWARSAQAVARQCKSLRRSSERRYYQRYRACAYIGVQIEQLDDAPTFQIMSFSEPCWKFVVMIGQVNRGIRV